MKFDIHRELRKIMNLCRIYDDMFEESFVSEILIRQINVGENIWDRKNWAGHLTASAVVIDERKRSCLVLGHKDLELVLTPGGHCDPFELPHESAERELNEETGMREFILHDWHGKSDMSPIDIDTHHIPKNDNKGEEPHLHHDFRYLFVSDEESSTELNEAESAWIGWRSWHFLEKAYPRVYERMEVLL